MAPLQDNNVREQRLQDGCCPNCGIRLYKIINVGGGVISKMKMFGKKSQGANKNNAGGDGGAQTLTRMVPLTVAGVVERGQCVKCVNGHPLTEGGSVTAVAIPTVQAIPVRVTPANEGKKPPPPQAKPELAPLLPNNQNGGNTNFLGGNLKCPPEDLLGLNSNNRSAPSSGSSRSSLSNSGKVRNVANVVYPANLSSNGESESEGSSSSYETDSEDEGQSLEDIPQLDLGLCRLESDHASSSLVNSLRYDDGMGDSALGGEDLESEDEDEDDRKPAAKPSDLSKQIEDSADRINKLRQEAAAVDMAFLESTTSDQKDASKELECPSGMSPEVFYQLPAEMQKEVMEQDKKGGSGSGSGGGDATTTSNADIDPETLASLPDHIRKEVLEQARREQHQQQPKNVAPVVPIKRAGSKKLRRASNGLSESTTAFLTECDINADEFESFPDEIKDDIMEERRRQSSGTSHKLIESVEKIREEDDFDLSGYDPETLASLPEDVRKEVLAEERREREKKRTVASPKPASVVGAHSVNIPAGYDPDTFEALPEDVRQELLDDAARQVAERRYSADGYDYGSIVDAQVVQARPAGEQSGAGPATSCTYEGEYNMIGKRHGDGELKWANGDKYVGKFKDGYIDGRGTITFHDKTEYTGQWKKNRFHGEGSRRFNNGNVYNGNYEGGKRQGQGKCYFANGDMYVGDWKEDTIHGFGRYYYNNGHSFEGMFRNGKRNGRGKYQLTDGRVEIYRYVNDSRVGDGVRWSANRKKAWRMNDGKSIKKVSPEVAAGIAKRCGPLVEES
jgi:hypothetical protein